MPALCNSYLACHLYNIDREDHPDGPFIIAQPAYDPADEQAIETVFLLRRDGRWIDEMAQPLLTDEERFLVFYDSSTAAAEALENVGGQTLAVLRHPVAVSDLEARLAFLQGNGYITQREQFAAKYVAAKRQAAP